MRGAQIDMLIDRADSCINLCEMKFSESEFVIDKAYANALKARRKVFQKISRTKKRVLFTFVTTHGIKSNPYSLEVVDSSVTMESLFSRPTGYGF
jgi:uncharacterized protein